MKGLMMMSNKCAPLYYDQHTLLLTTLPPILLCGYVLVFVFCEKIARSARDSDILWHLWFEWQISFFDIKKICMINKPKIQNARFLHSCIRGLRLYLQIKPCLTLCILATCAQNQKTDLVYLSGFSWVCPSVANRQTFILRSVKKQKEKKEEKSKLL